MKTIVRSVAADIAKIHKVENLNAKHLIRLNDFINDYDYEYVKKHYGAVCEYLKRYCTSMNDNIKSSNAISYSIAILNKVLNNE